MPSNKPNLRWRAKIAASAAFCVVGAAAGTGLYFANVAYVIEQRTVLGSSSYTTVGLSTDVPGSGVLYGNGKISGFGYDLMTYLASTMHFNPRVVHVPADPPYQLQMIQDREVDVMLANLAILPARQRSVTFAGPYMRDRAGILGMKDGPPISKSTDLAHKRVCVQVGSSLTEQLKSMRRAPEIVIYPSLGGCISALISGQVNAVTGPRLTLAGYAASNHRLRSDKFPYGEEENYGIGLPKGDLMDCYRFTGQLRTMLKSGKWDTYFRINYPGADPSEHKPDPNKLEKCE